MALHPLPIAKRPWERLSIDILEHNSNIYLVVIDLEHNSNIYLVVIDSYSKWIELKELKNKSISQIIHALDDVFSCHGSDLILSDNSPFNSKEFRDYLNVGDIKFVTSSPNYARSHGQVEKAVHICKSVLKKVKSMNKS
ncbi:hypothetical protein QE152_g22789 [Popillia japonica]|uniref:Integrase catalytic domain-containing protein n=1 Tax=Popillia japonica TaxID=7064 RepID=A0AAW1KJQ2_POPJA